MSKNYKTYSSVIIVIFFVGIGTSAQQIPSGRAISVQDILDLSLSLGGFLMILGGILGAVTIILSGIMYFFTGSNPQRIGTAKGIFKAGLIGTLILASAGLIITTVQNFATDPFLFFGGSSGGGGGNTAYYCGVVPGAINCSQPCTTTSDCATGYGCFINSGTPPQC